MRPLTVSAVSGVVDLTGSRRAELWAHLGQQAPAPQKATSLQDHWYITNAQYRVCKDKDGFSCRAAWRQANSLGYRCPEPGPTRIYHDTGVFIWIMLSGYSGGGGGGGGGAYGGGGGRGEARGEAGRWHGRSLSTYGFSYTCLRRRHECL